MLALPLEVVEARQATSTGTSSITSVTGVGAVGTDSTTRGDGSVHTAGTVVVGRAGGAVGRTVYANLLISVEKLGRLAALLANGTRFHVSGSTSITVGGEDGATIA